RMWQSTRHFCEVLLAALLLSSLPSALQAESRVEVPVLAAIKANDLGVFEVMLVWWDQKPEPQPIALQWLSGGVALKDAHEGAMVEAFRYAIERTPSIQHTGTMSVQGVAYVPTSADGP